MTDLQFKVNVEEVLAALDSVKAGLVTVKTEQEKAGNAGKNLFEPLEDSLDDLNKKMEEAIQLALDQKTAQEILKKATDDLNKVAKLEAQIATSKAGSYNELSAKVELYAIRLKQMSEEERKTTKEGKELELAFKSASQQLEKLDTNTLKNQKSTSKFKDAITDLSSRFKILGVDIVGQITSLKQTQDSLKGVSSGLGGASNAAKIFRVALASTGIGLLIVALGTLVAWFTKSREGTEKLSQVLSGVGAVINVIIDRAVKLGGAIVKIFSGDFVGAAEDAKAAVAGVNEELVREFKLAQQIEAQLQRVAKQEALLNIERSASRAKIKELNLLAEDTTKSTNVRIKAAQEALGIEQALLNKQLQNERTRIAAQLGQTEFTKETEKQLAKIAAGAVDANEVIASLGLSESTITDLEEFQGIVTNYFNTQAESLELQTTLNKKLNTIRKEGADKAKAAAEAEQQAITKLRDKYNDLAAVLAGQLDEAQTEQLTKEEQIIKARDKSIAQLAELKKELLGIAAQLKAKGVAVNVDVDQAISEIEQQIRNRAERELNAAFDTQPLALPPIKITPLTVADPRQQVEQLAQNLADNVADTSESFAEQLQGIGERIGEFNFFTDILKIDASTEQGKAEIEALKKAGEQTVAIINNIAAARVEAANKAVEAADREVDAREQALETELRLAELGFASNVSLRQQELEEARKAQDQALADQRKAAKAQLVIETVTQSINLITSSTNIIKGFSAIPIIGLPLGIAAVAAMFVAFAKAKADAFKAASAGAQFEQGGGGYVGKDGVIVGKRHRSGGVPLEVEGGEFFATDGSRFGVVNRRMTDKHFNLLQAINLDDKGGMSRALMDMLAVPGINYGYFDAMHRRDDEVRAGNVAVNIDLDAMRENNRLMSEFLEWQRQQTKVQEYPGHRIETTGNRTRIIRKAQA